MNKKFKLFSSALAIGALLGVVAPIMTDLQHPTSSVQAENRNEKAPDSVVLTADDVEISENNYIKGLKANSKDTAERLLKGGELIIPRTLNDKLIRGISSSAFSKATLQNMADKPSEEYRGISQVTFQEQNEASYRYYTIGDSAFAHNQIKQLNMSYVGTIGSSAFYQNQLTDFTMIHAWQIESSAFANNHITKIDLVESYTIGKEAFTNNALTEINLLSPTELKTDAFSNQRISAEAITPNKQGEIPFSSLKFGPKKLNKPELNLSNDKVITGINKIEIHNSDGNISVDDINQKITGINANSPFAVQLGVKFKFKEWAGSAGDYSFNPYAVIINPIEEGDNSSGGNGGNSGEIGGGNIGDGNQPDNNGNGNGSESGNNGNETKPEPAPQPEGKRPHTVYAKRGMRLHRNVSLTSPIRSYKKQSRAKAPNFRVRGIEYDKNGKKRYKVDGGYITAGSSYVADSHFRSNKVRQVRVLSNRINSYKDVKLSSNKKVRSYKKGTKLRVKRVVNWGRATRFELTNGRYITGNKQLLIMDQK